MGLETYMGILAAAFLGSLIGLERELHGQPAGLRTHMILAVGAALAAVLSISYSEVEDTHDGQNAVSGADGLNSTMKTESIQVAYTMGGISINAYSTETSNPNYDTDADNLNVNEIAIGLAF